jgi:outer membrane protein assembly factor BamB
MKYALQGINYMRFTLLFVTLLIFLAAMAPDTTAQEEHWNQFRGPNGDGTSVAKNLPSEFSETNNVRWKTPIHDVGWSSPVVWDGQVWLTTARDDGTELFALCVDLESGDVIHDIKVFDAAAPQTDFPELNTFATPTPIVEEGRVYVHFGSYGTACLDTQSGEKIWERRDFECRHYVQPASSPIIDGDSLFLTFDGVDLQYVVALDKRTGETIWRRDREHGRDFAAVLAKDGFDIDEVAKNKPGDNNRKSFGTPTVIEYEGQMQLISPAAEHTISYDPATGEENWYVMHEGMGWNVACRPVFANGLVYITQGVSGSLAAVDPSGTGDVTATHTVWSVRGRAATEIQSPLVIGDLLFTKSDSGGSMFCLDAKTGDRIWRASVGGGGAFYGSPVYADGQIYSAGQRGIVYVVSASREFELIAENPFRASGAAGKHEDGLEELIDKMKAKGMSDEEIKDYLEETEEKTEKETDDAQVSFTATPAIVGDAIILRSETHLYCIAK